MQGPVFDGRKAKGSRRVRLGTGLIRDKICKFIVWDEICMGVFLKGDGQCTIGNRQVRLGNGRFWDKARKCVLEMGFARAYF